VKLHFKIATLLPLLFLAAGLGAAPEQQQGGAGTTSRAADKADNALSPELQRVLDALDKANEKLKDVKAKVRYRREIPLLEESQECDGSLAYMKPNLIHLKLEKPRNEELYTDGKMWWFVSHDDKQVEIYKVASGEQDADAEQKEGSGADKQAAPAPAEASFLTFGYGQSSEKLLKQYRVTLESSGGPCGDEAAEEKAKESEAKVTCYRLRFEPRDKEAPAQFDAIETVVADDLWLPREIVLYESKGEIVHTYQLRDIKLNSGLKTREFTYKPLPGYYVKPPESW